MRGPRTETELGADAQWAPRASFSRGRERGMKPPHGLMIAAPRSGSGKTMLTLGLLRALRRAGRDVVGVKSGPDYIDPAFHAAASGSPSVNLDSWSMPPDLIASLAADAARDRALLICEASMGLFDGVPAAPGRYRSLGRCRGGARPAGVADGRRLRAGAIGGRGGEGLRDL